MSRPMRRYAERATQIAHKRERFLLSGVAQSEHMRGFVLHGMSLQLPADATTDMREGYAEARNSFIAKALSVDAIALVRS